jgi:hypothetical protein
VRALIAAFMPGASPPDVTNPIVFKILAPDNASNRRIGK